MLEIEVRGTLSEESFYNDLKRFSEQFGEPFRQRRMAIRIGTLNKYGINNRIKITNGIPEIVQKIGSVSSLIREELSFKIGRDIDEIYQAYLVLRNTITDPLLKRSVIMQFDNFIFKGKNFELKFAHQTGKLDKFVFEVEAKEDNLDLEKVCKELNLNPNMQSMSEEDWIKWNADLNIDADELDEKYIKALIKSYLKSTTF